MINNTSFISNINDNFISYYNINKNEMVYLDDKGKEIIKQIQFRIVGGNKNKKILYLFFGVKSENENEDGVIIKNTIIYIKFVLQKHNINLHFKNSNNDNEIIVYDEYNDSDSFIIKYRIIKTFVSIDEDNSKMKMLNEIYGNKYLIKYKCNYNNCNKTAIYVCKKCKLVYFCSFKCLLFLGTIHKC